MADKQTQAEEWILAEHQAGREPTIQQTRAAVGCGVDTVRRARRALRAKGLVADVRPHTPSRFQPKTFEELTRNIDSKVFQAASEGKDTKTPDKWLAAVEQVLAGQGRILTETERKQLISAGALLAGPTLGGNLAALLHKIESAEGQVDRYAPPAPMTDEQAAVRLSRLLAAYGPEVGEMAWNMAFSESETSSAANESEARVEGEAGEGWEGDARVQGGDTPLGLEEGPPSEEPEAGDSHSHVGSGDVAPEEEVAPFFGSSQ